MPDRPSVSHAEAYAALQRIAEEEGGTASTRRFIRTLIVDHDITIEAAQDLVFALQAAGVLRITNIYRLEPLKAPAPLT